MERALALLGDEPQATDLVLQLMANLGLVLGALGSYDAADRMYADRAAASGTRHRATPGLRLGFLSAAWAFYRGRWDDALAEAGAAAQLPLDATIRPHLAGIGAQVAVPSRRPGGSDESACAARTDITLER